MIKAVALLILGVIGAGLSNSHHLTGINWSTLGSDREIHTTHPRQTL
jgi:hypothetical protein